jgi:hypothetical protein
MPVASRNKQAKPTVLYGLLARQALQSLEPHREVERSAYLKNVIRLLERYRFDAFNDLEKRGILDRRSLNRYELKTRKIEFDKLNLALDSARTSVFAGCSKDRAASKLIGVLTKINTDIDDVAKSELKTLRQFLVEFQRNLKDQ